MRNDFVFLETLRRTSYSGQWNIYKGDKMENLFFVVYLISKLCWNIRTSTWMQTRVNSTRPSGKEAKSRINEDKLTFFGPPVITQIREDHLQRLKIEHQLKEKLPEKQCAYFHDSCSWRAYCKRNEIKSVLCEMKLCTLRNANIYFAKWKSALSLYPPSMFFVVA